MNELDLAMRAAARQRRWRRLSRIVSGSLAVAAVGGAVYLGANGPLVSPVQPPAAAAAAADPAPAAVDDDRGARNFDGGGRGGRGDAADFGPRR